jgi:hypothetical protein
MAIASEAFYSLAGEMANTQSPQEVETMVREALKAYHSIEGARSLYRAVSSQLINGC